MQQNPVSQAMLRHAMEKVSLPTPTPADAGKVPTVNEAGTGYELQAQNAGGRYEHRIRFDPGDISYPSSSLTYSETDGMQPIIINNLYTAHRAFEVTIITDDPDPITEDTVQSKIWNYLLDKYGSTTAAADATLIAVGYGSLRGQVGAVYMNALISDIYYRFINISIAQETIVGVGEDNRVTWETFTGRIDPTTPGTGWTVTDTVTQF